MKIRLSSLIPPFHFFKRSSPEPKLSAFGHGYKLLSETVIATGNVMSNPDMLQKVVKIGLSYLALKTCCDTTTATKFTRLLTYLNIFDNIVDGTRSPEDANWILSGQAKKDRESNSTASFIGRVLFIGANVCGILLCAKELNLLDLGKAAEAMAKVRIFGISPFVALVSQVTLVNVCLGIVAGAYTAFGVDAAFKISKGEHNVGNWATVAFTTSEVVLKSALILNSLNVIATTLTMIAFLTIFSNTLGIGCYVWEMKQREKNAKQAEA